MWRFFGFWVLPATFWGVVVRRGEWKIAYLDKVLPSVGAHMWRVFWAFFGFFRWFWGFWRVLAGFSGFFRNFGVGARNLGVGGEK